MRKAFCTIIFGICSIIPNLGLAQTTQETTEILAVIRETAIELCPSTSTESRITLEKATAKVGAELPSLLNKLLNINAEVSGEVSSQLKQGVEQEQLAKALQDVLVCRVEVLKILQSRIDLENRKSVSSGKVIQVLSDQKDDRVRDGPILRIFYKNNITALDMAQVANLLPTFSVVPGSGSHVDPRLAAGALFVNRDKVTKNEVIQTITILSSLGIPIKTVVQARNGDRREIQVGTSTAWQDNAAIKYLRTADLKERSGSSFWRAAWNKVGYCSFRKNYVSECTLDEDARPQPIN